MAGPSSASWTHSGHCDRYNAKVQEIHPRLCSVWDELELTCEEQTEQLLRISAEAESVWDKAMHAAQTSLETARQQIVEAERRTAKLRSDLSDEHFTAAKAEGEEEEPKTVQGKLRAAQDKLHVWIERRNARQQKFEDLKSKCEQKRRQLGFAGSSIPVSTVTLYVLEGLAMELKNLEMEQVERLRRLDLRMKELRKHCMALGEEEGAVAARIHPSLAASRDTQSSTQDLSDKTFDGLREAVLEFQDLEHARSEQATTLLDTLRSLWEAMKVAEDDVDREIFTRLLTGQNRLHRASHDRCRQEITRLEGARKDLMLSIISQKRQEIAAICKGSHLTELAQPPMDAEEPGEISDALARTMKQLGSVTAEAENRKAVLDQIASLSATLTESEWLATYEDDPHKYKGRDSTRNIQRAIAATEQRRQLPNLLDSLKASLEAYRHQHGVVFMYDGVAYQEVILPGLRAQIDADDLKRSQGSKQKGPSSAMKAPKAGSSTPRKAPKPAAKPTTASKKTAVPSFKDTPPTIEKRRGQSFASQVSSVPRSDSLNSARSDVENASLSDRVNRLLGSHASSPAVSRTTSNMSILDSEAPASQIPKPKVTKKKAVPGTVRKDIDGAGLDSTLSKLNRGNSSDGRSTLDGTEKIPAIHLKSHRRSISS